MAPGEGTALVTEQLALDQRLRKRRAVDGNERSTCAAAPFVEEPREQLLAGAGLAEEQHRRVSRRHEGGLLERGGKGTALAEDVAERARRQNLLAQMGDMPAQSLAILQQ